MGLGGQIGLGLFCHPYSHVMVSSLEEMWKRFHLSNEEKWAIVIKLEEVWLFSQ